MIYRIVESLYCILETNTTLYANWNLNKNFKNDTKKNPPERTARKSREQ